MRWTEWEKGDPVTRTLVARELDGEAAGFPPLAQWLEANIHHWGIETGLHARLDASRHDDRCRLRRRKAVRIHAMFNRWANSLFMHWRTRAHHTTTDFTAAMAENHDRRAVSAILSRSFPS